MNETDPLADLRDIHLPPAVEAWPPAIGWWLLALLVIGTVAALAVWAYRNYRRRAWKRQALALVPDPQGRTAADTAYYSELNQLLKRAARVCYPAAGTDEMSGPSWQSFLASRAPQLPAGDLAALARAPFQRQADIPPELARDLARNWLRSQPC